MALARVVVREAQPDDAEGLIAVWADLVAVAGRRGVLSAQVPSVPAVRRRVAELDDDPRRRVLVAVNGGDVVGAAVLSREPLSPLHDEPAVRMSYLHVLPGHRRRGIGHALLSAAASWAADSGAEHLAVDVHPQARDANRFLARLGFGQLLVQRVAPVASLRRRLTVDSAAFHSRRKLVMSMAGRPAARVADR